MDDSEGGNVREGPLPQRLVDKKWNVRKAAYEDLIATMHGLDVADPAAAKTVQEYIGFAGSIASEKNVAAQTVGLDAIVACAEASENTASMPGIYDKVISNSYSGNVRVVPKAQETVLRLVEFDRTGEGAMNALVAEFANKQAKVVVAAIVSARALLSTFGAKVVPCKGMLKALPALFEHKDDAVRKEASALAVEAFRWLRDPVKQVLAKIRPAQLKELEDLWTALPAERPSPTKQLHSAVVRSREGGGTGGSASGSSNSDSGSDSAGEDPEEAAAAAFLANEPVALLEEVVNADWYAGLASAKWNERKDKLQELITRAEAPRLREADYAELTRNLRKVIDKDANVIVVALAVRACGLLARGLRAASAPYAKMVIPSLFGKFKEKKAAVVTEIHQALDMMFPAAVSIGDAMDDIVASLDSKVPSVKEQTLKFLLRVVRVTYRSVLTASVKALGASVLKCTADSAPEVRECSFELLALLTSVLGEKPLHQFVSTLDAIRTQKVKDMMPKDPVVLPREPSRGGATRSSAPAATQPSAAAQAELRKQPSRVAVATAPAAAAVPTATATTAKAQTSAASTASGKMAASSSSSSAAVAATRPAAQTSRKSAPTEVPRDEAELVPQSLRRAVSSRELSSVPGGARSDRVADAAAVVAVAVEDPVAPVVLAAPAVVEPPFALASTDDEAIEAVSRLYDAALAEQLADAGWSIRLSAVQRVASIAQDAVGDNKRLAEGTLRLVLRSPGFQDSNWQVLRAMFQLVKQLADSYAFDKLFAPLVVSPLMARIADLKLRLVVTETLAKLVETVGPDVVFAEVYRCDSLAAAPRALNEAMQFVRQTIEDYGAENVQLAPLVAWLKLAVDCSDNLVRTNAVKVVGKIYLYARDDFKALFADMEGPQGSVVLKEIDKYSASKTPDPTKVVRPPRAVVMIEPPAEPTATSKTDAAARISSAAAAASFPASVPASAPQTAAVEASAPASAALLDVTLIGSLGDADWRVRRSALEGIRAAVDEGAVLPTGAPHLDDLMLNLKARLKDPNGTLIQPAIDLMSKLPAASSVSLDKFVRVLLPALASNVGDNKKQLRDSALLCLDQWMSRCSVDIVVPALAMSLTAETGATRREMLSWLLRHTDDLQGRPNAAEKLLPATYQCLLDKAGDIRHVAETLMKEIAPIVGYDVVRKHAMDLKSAEKAQVAPLISRIRDTLRRPAPLSSAASMPVLPSSPTPSASAALATPGSSAAAANRRLSASMSMSAMPSSATAAVPSSSPRARDGSPSTSASGARRSIGALTTSASRNSMSRSSAVATPTATAAVPAEVAPHVGLFAQSGLRSRREAEDEVAGRWSLAAGVTDELVTRLESQLRAAGASETLVARMVALEDDGLPAVLADIRAGTAANATETVDNLDLVLKWATLGLFRYEGAAQAKLVAFVVSLTDFLERRNVVLSDYVAGILVPAVVLRLDVLDPNVARLKFFRALPKLHPASKVFDLLLPAIQPRSASSPVVVAAVLDQMAQLLKRQGFQACSRPSQVMPRVLELTTHRDATLRESAINFLRHCYVLLGDNLLKHIGSITEGQRKLILQKPRERATAAAAPAAALEDTPAEASAPAAAPMAVSAPAKAETSQPHEEERPEAVPVPTEAPGASASVSILQQVQPTVVPGRLLEAPTPSLPNRIRTAVGAPKLDDGGLAESLSASDGEVVIEAIKRMCENGADDSLAGCIPFANRYVDTLTVRMQDAMLQPEASMRLLKYVVNGLVYLVSRTYIARAVSRATLQRLIPALLYYLASPRLRGNDELKRLMEMVNLLTVKTMKNADIGAALGVLLSFLHTQCVATGTTAEEVPLARKLIDLGIKSLLQLTKLLSDDFEPASYPALLSDIDAFLVAHANGSQETDSNALRAVVTLVHHVVELNGLGTLRFFAQLEPSTSSSQTRHVVVMVNDLLEKKYGAEALSAAASQPAAGPASGASDVLLVRIELTSIFRQLSNVETVKDGFQQLHRFKQAHADFDLQAYVGRASPQFQVYIRRMLAALDEDENRPDERASAKSAAPQCANATAPAPTAASYAALAENLQRLRTVHQRYGVTATATSVRAVDGASTGQTLEKIREKMRAASAASSASVAPAGAPSTAPASSAAVGTSATSSAAAPAADLDALRQRLDRITNSMRKPMQT